MAERVEVLEIDLSDIQQEARDTGKTLKDLRKEVKDLRTQLENTEMGTEDFASALDQLTRKQQELTNVTKSGVAAQKGSYNDLVNQMALLKKEWRSTADEAERAAIGEKIGSINAKLKELDASLGNYQRNVGNYQGEMGQLATNLDNVSGAISGASPKIQSFNSEVNGLSTSTESLNTSSTDWVHTAENSVKVTAGITGAFQAAQGAINLMGIESEATTQMIAQMQNVMAITEGLKSIAEGIRSFDELKTSVQGAGLMAKLFGTETKAMTAATNAQTVATTGATVATHAFKKALIATGIGAIVVLIGTLIANLDKLKNAFSKLPLKNTAIAARELNAEMGKLAAESAAEKIARVKDLANAYSKLGDNLNSKKKFVKEYKEELADMGIEMNTVNDAEKIFRDETGDYINAIMVRAKADAARKKATEDYQKELTKIVEAEKEVEKAKRGVLIAETNERNSTDAYYSTPYWAYEEQRVAGTAVAAAALQVSNAKDNLTDAEKKLKDLQTEADAAMKKLFDFADAQDAIANSKLTSRKPSGGSGGSGGGKSDAEKAAEALAERQKAIDEELRLHKLSEEEKLIDELDKKYDEWMKAYEGNYEKQAEILEWYNDEYGKIVEEKLDAEIDAQNNAAEIKKKLAEEEKKRLAEEKQAILDNIDAINKKYQNALEVAKVEYEISEAANENADNEVARNQALLTLLEQERVALIAQRDALMAYKDELIATNKSTVEVDKALADNAAKLAINNENQIKALASATAAKLDVINGIIGSVSDSMDQLLALDLGSKWSDELGMAFSAIQTGLSKTSEALKSGQKGWQAYGEMAAAGLNATAGILNSIAEKQDETDKEGFEKQKKLQIAAATMAMLGGVVSAMTSAFAPTNAWMTIWGQAAAAAAMSALVITTGAIQIANIKKQTFDGSGGGDGGGTSTPSIPTLSALQMMDTGVQATTNIEGVSAESAVTDTKVYVVETDITNTQNNVKSTVAEATF